MEKEKNNLEKPPQADNNVDAGGQADLQALKAQIASQNDPSDATETKSPEPTPPAEPEVAATTKKYAGKFTSEEELEKGYVELEKKLGSKSDLERIGEKLYKYSGQELTQLEAELDAASLKNQTEQTPSDTPQAPDPEVARLKTDIAVLKSQNLEQKLKDERAELFKEHPEAAKYDSTLSDLWKNVDTKKTFKEIYQDRFATAEEAVKSAAQDESKESFTVESSVGKETGSVDDLDPSKLSVEQLREILPKHNNHYAGEI